MKRKTLNLENSNERLSKEIIDKSDVTLREEIEIERTISEFLNDSIKEVTRQILLSLKREVNLVILKISHVKEEEDEICYKVPCGSVYTRSTDSEIGTNEVIYTETERLENKLLEKNELEP